MTGRVSKFGEWHIRDGVFYSKTNCFPNDQLHVKHPTRRVAVYGTLKCGFSNHRLLESSEFVGTGMTKNAYPLEVDGLPYLHDMEGEGEQVTVEVYDVTPQTFHRLDLLEGNPQFYRRKVIPIYMHDWSVTYAWVYFIQNRELAHDAELWDSYRGREVDRYPVLK